MSITGIYTQENRKLSIKTSLGDDALLLRSLTGHESISQLFHFDLDLLSENDSIPFSDIVGKNVTVRLRLADDSERVWNGVISRFSQGAKFRRFTRYRAEMVPWLWFLTRATDCRIFQRKTVPDIVQETFRDLGFFDYFLRLYGKFGEREYCVQYRETDFNFVSRLLEKEGIYYFFEHEEGKHTLVLANPPGGHKACPKQPSARYLPLSAGVREDDVIWACNIDAQVVPGSFAHADYNFLTPQTHLFTQLSGPNAFEVYDYPGIFKDLREGDTVARVRLEEQTARSVVLRGESSCRAFSTGYQFELKDYYRSELNGEYLLTSVTHSATVGLNYETGAGAGDEFTYTNTFECIPAEVTYRCRSSKSNESGLRVHNWRPYARKTSGPHSADFN